MISVRHVSKGFGRVAAVRDVSFDVARGEVVGLLGSNGAGKTTTIRMITGIMPPDAGRVAIDGHDTIESSAEARRRIGYLPESAPGYGEMAVRDFLAFRGRLYGLSGATLRAAIGRVVGLCELEPVRARRLGHLSKGYRQRVGLAAAMIHAPPAIVLDEPTNALDPRQIRHTRQLVRELGRQGAVLFSSHVLAEVEQSCDRVVVLAHGRVCLDARPRDLLDDPAAAAPCVVEYRWPAGTPRHPEVGLARALGERASVEDLGETADGWSRARVTPRGGRADAREVVAAACAALGLTVRELARERPSLERVITRLMESQGPSEPAWDAPAAATGAGAAA